MWWMLAGCALAGLLGLEIRRVLRERADEQHGPRRYAQYAEGRPDRPLQLIEIEDAGCPPPPVPAAPARERAGSAADEDDCGDDARSEAVWPRIVTRTPQE